MRIIIILVFLALCSSCGKNITIKGKVYNPVTNLGIENIQVIITRQKINLIPGSQDGVGSKTIASTTTDANGNYSFSFKKNKNRTYYMYFLNDDELFYRVESEMKFLESNSSQTIDYKLVPSAYIKKKIKNINCFSSEDKIEIFTSDDYGEIPANLPYILNGCIDQVNENFTKTISGNIYYHWIVTKNNITTHHYDTIFLAPYEQRYYEILY